MWTEKVHLGERERLARLERRGMRVAEVALGRDVGGGHAFLVTGCLNLAQESERSSELWEPLKGLKNVDTHLEEEPARIQEQMIKVSARAGGKEGRWEHLEETKN